MEHNGNSPDTHSEPVTERDLTLPYAPTPQELEAVADMARKREETPLPPMSFVDGGDGEEHVLKAQLAHKDGEVATAALQKALGQPWQEGLDHMLLQLAHVTGTSQPIGSSGFGTSYNAAIQAVAQIGPKDGVEAMLAAQMTAVHNMTMAHAARAMAASDPVRRDMAEKATNRLARTFTAQIEALKKYRSSSEQKIVVQHVNVSDNAQAVISTHVGTGEE